MREAQNRRREIWSLGIGAWGQLAAGDLCLQAGRTEQANALARELLSLAARTHMDSFIPKAVQIIDASAA